MKIAIDNFLSSIVMFTNIICLDYYFYTKSIYSEITGNLKLFYFLFHITSMSVPYDILAKSSLE